MNVIARLWYHSLLAGHYKNDGDDSFIRYSLNLDVGDYHFESKEINGDYVYICETHPEILICCRGTHGKQGWLSNLKCGANRLGFGRGFYEGASAFKDWIVPFVEKRHNKNVQVFGHSRGGPIAQLLGLWIKRYCGKYTKPITFDSPRLANKKGIARFRHYKVEPLNLLDRNDIVDNVGVNAFFGKRPGKDILLPRAKEYTFIERIKDLIPGWGHAYSETTENLIEYFYGRGMKKEAEYLKSIRHLAAI